MFTRIALAALMLAAVPMMGVTTAEAAKGKSGKDNGRIYQKYQTSNTGNKTVVKSKYTTKNNRYIVTSTKSTTKTKRGAKTSTVIVRREVGPSLAKKLRNYYVGTGKYLKRTYGSKSSKRGNAYKCVVAAKRRGGSGNRLWGIGGEKHGAGACDRAMIECRSELRNRKSSGRNPNAKCVIIKRG